MRFGVLGPIEARVGDERLDLGHPVRQCVLAALLVDAGRVATPDQLVERVWGDRLPYRAKHNLYTYISRLRRVVAIDRRQGGCALDVQLDSVDLYRFRELAAKGALPLLEETRSPRAGTRSMRERPGRARRRCSPASGTTTCLASARS